MPWQHGSAVFPLTASTAKTLLEDVDPALFHITAFVKWSLNTYLGARLAAQAQREHYVIAQPVAQDVPIELTPAVLADNPRLPLLALYRKTEEQSELTLSRERDVAELEFTYLLPALSPAQAVRLAPILRGVTRVIAHALREGKDPGYQNGVDVWALAGIRRARLISAAYGTVQLMDNDAGVYRAVTGKIEVTERDYPYAGDAVPFTVAGITADVQPAEGDVLEDVVVDDVKIPQP